MCPICFNYRTWTYLATALTTWRVASFKIGLERFRSKHTSLDKVLCIGTNTFREIYHYRATLSTSPLHASENQQALQKTVACRRQIHYVDMGCAPGQIERAYRSCQTYEKRSHQSKLTVRENKEHNRTVYVDFSYIEGRTNSTPRWRIDQFPTGHVAQNRFGRISMAGASTLLIRDLFNLIQHYCTRRRKGLFDGAFLF